MVLSRRNEVVKINISSELKLCIVDNCVPKASKAQGHPKWICCIQLISVRFDRGKLFRSVRTSSNIYLAKFQGFFLGETKL